MHWEGVIEHYRQYLPVSAATPVVTLLEGNTPLVETPRLAREIGCPLPMFVKCEGLNPTGSFKDRGMTMAISKALEEGARAVACASTGNTAASAAAYAARAGLDCVVLVAKHYVAMGKLAQTLIHHATVIAVEGTFDDCLPLARELSARYPITLVNSVNPYRIEGQKTGSFEIVDALGRAPAYHAIPVGNAGNITAYWKGYREYRELGKIARPPQMLGFQAAGAAPIVLGHKVDDPQTVATAIKVGNPASWQQAEAARDESGGRIDMVSDQEIIRAYEMLAGLEGIFCEPASAASVAGVAKLVQNGYFERERAAGAWQEGDALVCILTGHGLKDPDCAIKQAKAPASIPASFEALVQVLGY